jgi:DNA polymerase III epsilon subunit-like protein
MKAIVFDTETTGLIENRSRPLDKQPEIIDYYAALVDLETGKVENEWNYLIKPSKKIPAIITKITGYVDSDFDDAPPFGEVAEDIIDGLAEANVVIAHNFSFDMEMVDIELERLGREVVWPKRAICTVEQTIHLQGYRLTLMGMHELLFGEKFDEAHKAKPDTQALIRCAVELRSKGVI